MNVLRRLSLRGLAALLIAVTAAGAIAAAVAMTALGGGGATPPPEALPQAIHDALTAAPVEGVSARVTFANRLLGSSALGSLASGGSALLSGASGRLWVTQDGHLRLELQSDAGDAQIVSDGKTLTVYDASSNTAYELTLPQQSSGTGAPKTPPTIDQITSALGALAQYADVSGPTPDSIAGQPAYTVQVTPKGDSGLLGGAQLSWDAATGVPLHVAILAKGQTVPVLELTVDQISYGTVPASDVEIAPPAGAKVVQLTVPTGVPGTGAAGSPVTGLDAVAAAVPFPLVAPATLDGQARSEVRLTGSGPDAGAIIVYGKGLGSLIVAEHAKVAGSKSPLDVLPPVTVDGSSGHELVTALGTALGFDRNGVSFIVAGSVTQSDAEDAARALAS